MRRRPWRIGGLVVLLFGLALAPGLAAAASRTAIRAADFLDGIGINVHMSYGDGAYADTAAVRRALDSIGLTHVRDMVPDVRTPEGRAALRALKGLARAGVGITLVLPGDMAASTAVARAEDLEAQHSGAVAALEGYNEINNWPVTVDGIGGLRGAARGQKRLYQAVQRSPALRDRPVLDMTGDDLVRERGFSYGADLTGYADRENYHLYPQNGDQPGLWLRPTLKAGKIHGRPAAKVVTEFGYFTLPGAGRDVIGVDQDTQAKGILNGLFDARRMGAERLFLYELLDQKPDPGGRQSEMHFGLYTATYRAKTAARALGALSALLADPSPQAGTFRPRPLALRIGTDEHAGLRHLLLAKADGSYVLALWREPPFWRGSRPINGRSTLARLRLGRAVERATLHDPLLGQAARQTWRGVDSLDIGVEDHVVLVRLIF